MRFLGVLILLVASVPSWALDSFLFTIDTQNGVFPAASSYGTVKLELIGGSIKFTVDLAPESMTLIGTGGKQAFGFNGAAAGSVVIGSLSSGYFSFDEDSERDVGFADMGSYRYGVGGPKFSESPLNVVTFTVSKSSGSFAGVEELVEVSTNPPGSQKVYFGMHAATGGGDTGFLGVTPGGNPFEVVPEPGTYGVLSGMGIAGLMLLRRFRS